MNQSQTAILASQWPAHPLVDDHGTIMAEYAVLLCLVAVGCSLAVVGLGVPLVQLFIAQQVWLQLAVP